LGCQTPIGIDAGLRHILALLPHPTSRVLALATAVAAFVAIVDTASFQTPAGQNPLVFRGATTLVPVDVRVLDRSDKPITDLTESDFTLFENDVPQPIRHFSKLTLVSDQAKVNEPLETAAPTADALTSPHRRVFLIVLGRGRLQGISKGVDGMLHFVHERLLPQDAVAVMAWNRATDFTTDHARIAAVLERFKRTHEEVEAKLNLRFSGLAGLYGSRDIPRRSSVISTQCLAKRMAAHGRSLHWRVRMLTV